jgi:hypothetical protein
MPTLCGLPPPFQDGEERREAPTRGNAGAVRSSTCSGRKVAQVRMIARGVVKPRHVFGNVFKRWMVAFNSPGYTRTSPFP